MTRRILSLALVALLANDPADAQTSLGYRGVNSSGVFPASGLARSWPDGGPELLWKYEVDIGFAGANVVSNRVYIAGGLTSYLYVFDLGGELLSRIRIGDASFKRFSGTRSTPLIVGDVAITTTPVADIYGVDLKAGTIRWKLNAWKDFAQGNSGWGYPETPALHKGMIILNTVSRTDTAPPLVAVDARNGKKVWGMDPGKGKGYSAADVSTASFVHNGRSLLVCPTFCYLVCLEADSGKLLWEIPTCGEKTLTPVYSDGYLLTSLRRRILSPDPTPAETNLPPEAVEDAAIKPPPETGAMTPREIMRQQQWGADELVMLKLNADGTDYKALWGGRTAPDRFSHAVILDKRVYCFGNPNEEPEAIEPGDAGLRKALMKRAKGASGSSILCLDAETGRLLNHIPAETPGHIMSADGMIYAVDIASAGGGTGSCARVSLLKPTPDGFELTGRFMPDLAKTERGLREIEWQASACPVIAEGRLFLRYGPLLVYELRADKSDEIRKMKAIVTKLAAQLANGKEHDRIAAVDALLQMGWQAGPVAETLVAALKDENETVRQRAAKTLAKIGPAVIPRLVGAMMDEKVLKEGLATGTLVAVMKADNVGAALVEAAATSTAVRDNARALLPKYSTEAVPALCEVVTNGGRELRWWGINVLKDMGPKAVDAIPVLTGRTGVENEWFCALIAETLGSMGPAGNDAVPCLRGLLKHGYHQARLNAAVALGNIGASDAETIAAIRATMAQEEKDKPSNAEAMKEVLLKLEGTKSR